MSPLPVRQHFQLILGEYRALVRCKITPRSSAIPWILLLAGVLLSGAGLVRAAEIPPPSLVLQHPRNQVVVAAFVERLRDGRYRFTKLEDLRGPDEAPTDLLIRAPDWLQAHVGAGVHYVLGYSSYIGNPRFPKDFIIDSDGPRMLMSAGLEPALFRDDAALRSALLHPIDAKTLNSTGYLAQVVAGLGNTDQQLQSFYAAEITQNAALAARKDAALVAAIKRLVRNPDGHPSARADLLRLVARHKTIYGEQFLADAIRDILHNAPLNGYQDAQPHIGLVLRAALDIAESESLSLPLPDLIRLVRSDSAALAEPALLAIRRADPALEQNVLRDTLGLSLLSAGTREFLKDHQRRLDRMTAATATQSTIPQLGEGH
jgi:hypothetical protein